MQFIQRKWYIVYNWVLVAISGIFVIVYILSLFIGPLKSSGANYGLTLNAAIFAGLAAVAGSAGFAYFSSKISNWLGAIITTMFFDVFIIAQLSHTNTPYFYVYMVIWFLLVAYSGSFGLIVVLTSDFIALLIGVMKARSSILTLSTDFKILILGTVFLSLVPYLLFWRVKIKNNRTISNVSTIEGMPNDTQKQNETLIESIADGVVVIDKSNKITLINPSAAQMTEWEIADAIGMDVGLVLSINDEDGKAIPPEKNPFTIVLQTNKKTEIAASLTGRRGKKMVVSLVVSPVIIDQTTVAMVGVIRDITVQRAAEKQRADFISTASHEMRTPVAAIEGYLSLAMNDKVSSIDSRARDYIEKAHTSTRQLGKLFQDLLTSSRAEDGRLANHPQVVEMSQFIQRLSESFQLAAQQKHLVVDFVMMDNSGQPEQTTGQVVPPLYYVHVDPERMSEVITNIYDNAVKYTQAGKITVGLGGDAKNVQVFVKDTGAGIPADDIPHLFQKFYRVDNSAVRTIGGTGLGLFICKKIVELYGGQIWVDSVLGQGSTFRINIPRLTSQQADALTRSEALENQIAMPQSNVTL